MAVLEKIRVKFGLAISIIIALALLSFIIDPSTLESALQGMSSKYDVGKIAGRAIRYTDYAEDVQRFTDINEVISGSTAHNEQELKQIRDAAWQSLVDKYMFIKNAQDAGITVGKAEMLDLTTGNNPSPVILQSFSGAQGFDSQAVVDFVQNSIPQDQTGRLQTYWNYLQTTVNSQAVDDGQQKAIVIAIGEHKYSDYPDCLCTLCSFGCLMRHDGGFQEKQADWYMGS